jgi:hypothetical protein
VEGTPALEPLRKGGARGRRTEVGSRRTVVGEEGGRIDLRNRCGADRRGLSDDALRRRWTKSALPGGICTLLYRTLYNKDNCRARYNKTVLPKYSKE